MLLLLEIGMPRRLHRPRHHPVLRLLRAHAGPALLPDRHLGERRAALRGDQVLPVHAGRQPADVPGPAGDRALGLSARTGTTTFRFSIPALTESLASSTRLPARSGNCWVFLALFAGFAIKVPLFPLHTWLPLAHVQAPTAGSVHPGGRAAQDRHLRLPAVQPADAARGHGRLRCPGCSGWRSIGIIYGALVALAQIDIKKLVAYSSVSHLGFCMLGLFALNPTGMQGSVLQMINHGLSTGGLFAVVGMIYERYHTRQIADLAAWPAAAAGWPSSWSVHVVQHRPAGAERLRRRVPDPARHVPAGLGRLAGRLWPRSTW